MRNHRARRAASSCRTWVRMARWCRLHGDRGGAALALRIAASFRRYVVFLDG